ncbi:MAG: hypothetical protein IPG85_07265 [Bacteroidetes bacterium]|nr:hypothetical protein [Bacteroidota bacterium]
MKKNAMLQRCIFLLILFLVLSVKAHTQTLQDAFAKKDTSLIYKLLAEGANINEVDKYGATF